jgi:hypothetical protein
MTPEFIDPLDLADMLGVTPTQLCWWRKRNVGPRWFKVGTCIRYDRKHLAEWLDAEMARGYTDGTGAIVCRDASDLEEVWRRSN